VCVCVCLCVYSLTLYSRTTRSACISRSPSSQGGCADIGSEQVCGNGSGPHQLGYHSPETPTHTHTHTHTHTLTHTHTHTDTDTHSSLLRSCSVNVSICLSFPPSSSFPACFALYRLCHR